MIRFLKIAFAVCVPLMMGIQQHSVSVHIDSMTLTVYPRVVQPGASIRLTCRVPRHKSNRAVTWGFDNWTSTTRQLDGVYARVTWESVFDHVPCDPGRAFCEVWRVEARNQRVSQEVIVVGCDGEKTE